MVMTEQRRRLIVHLDEPTARKLDELATAEERGAASQATWLLKQLLTGNTNTTEPAAGR